jgi:hypothetical protein
LKEKKQAIIEYQIMEMAITINTAATLIQSGACVGNFDTNRLPKKAAVLGLEKLVNNPFWKATKLLPEKFLLCGNEIGCLMYYHAVGTFI